MVRGTSIIINNSKNKILLYLRDDNPLIDYPNMWSLPGGHIEANETPQECIEREIKEELGIELKNIKHFVTSNFQYGEEHTFYIKSDIDIDNINLKEGQGLEWFGKEDMGQMNLAYEDKSIALKFLKSGL